MKNKSYPLYNVPQIKNLKDMIIYCAETYKDSIAFQFEQNKEIIKVSFREFLNDINNLGTALHCRSLHNEKIALIAENSYEWILTYFAVINGGNVIVPIDPDTQEDQIKKLINNTDPSVITCSQKYFEEIQKVNKCTSIQKIIVIEKDIPDLLIQGKTLLYEGERSYIDYNVKNNDCSVIVYTSGTTSQPKGVMLSHKNLASDTVAAIKNVYFAGSSILVLPLYHTFAFIGVLCVMLSGRTISINKNLKDFKEDLIRYNPQNLILVPMILESLYKQIWIQAKKKKKEGALQKLIRVSNIFLKIRIDLRRILFSSVHKSFGGKLEFIVSGGASIPDKYVKGFRAMGIQILNGYGISECSPVVTVNRNCYYRDNSVGQALDGVKIKIIDDEILVKGDIVFSGYYQDESGTHEAFQDGWFKTGDLGYLDDDGFLYVTGRKKFVIVLSNGKNISPEELENYFYALDYVKEALVYQNGDRIEAEAYLGEEADVYENQIEQDLETINNQLPAYKNITKVKIRKTEFPKTPTKKIKRG